MTSSEVQTLVDSRVAIHLDEDFHRRAVDFRGDLTLEIFSQDFVDRAGLVEADLDLILVICFAPHQILLTKQLGHQKISM